MSRDIVLKSGLYGFALFMTPFADKVIPILFADKWPSPQMTLGCAILGSIAASIGLKAYFDGSYERGRTGLAPSRPLVPAKTP